MEIENTNWWFCESKFSGDIGPWRMCGIHDNELQAKEQVFMLCSASICGRPDSYRVWNNRRIIYSVSMVKGRIVQNHIDFSKLSWQKCGF